MSNTVYHYTSADTALRILRDGKLRFTECGSLDDKSELSYYKEPLEAAWRDTSIARNEKVQNLHEHIEHSFDTTTEWGFCRHATAPNIHFSLITRYGYYVFCTTSCADCMPMWLSYCGPNRQKGVALGLDLAALSALGEELADSAIELSAGEVSYCLEDQKREFSEQMGELYKWYDETSACLQDSFDLERLGDEFNERLAEFAYARKPFLKRASFDFECETRAVLRIPETLGDTKLLVKGFRSGGAGQIIPYYDLSIDGVLPSLVKSVTVSPYSEIELASKSWKMFLRNMGLNWIETKRPSVDMRWRG